MRKLIIFLLFLVFTVMAVGFFSLNTMTLATNFVNINETTEADGLVAYAAAIANAKEIVVINNPFASFLSDFAQIQIVHCPVDGDTPAAGYLYIVAADKTMPNTVAVAANATVVSAGAVWVWLFMLLLIILLPKKRSKKNVKALAGDVVDEEMSYRPAPKKSKRRKSYDEDEYDED